MYQKPDFVQVSVKVEDVFANYLTTGCPHDSYFGWTLTGLPEQCKASGSAIETEYVFTSLSATHQCYSTQNP